jgi:GWxTD domain-containing protein
MKPKLHYLFLLFALPMACSLPEATVKPDFINLSNMYNPSYTNFHPAYNIYHNSPNSSLLLVKIFPVELLYTGTIQPDKLIGQAAITFRLYDITDPDKKTTLADSGIVNYSFERENADKRYITQIQLNTEPGKRYQLMVLAEDKIRKEQDLKYMYVDRTSPLSEQNFLVTDTGNKTPVFQPYVIGNKPFKLKYNGAGFDSIFVRYYGNEPPLPKPSFSLTREREFLEKPDSLWVLPFRNDIDYQLNYEGVYHFQSDTGNTAGVTFFNFGESYPKIDEAPQMADPLVYLMTSTEYRELKSNSNQKLALDKFWLDIAGDAEIARDLIRVYYNRVFIANFYFTSFKPGWKTDRGMIFIIYGPPQSVRVTATQEKWIYFKNNFTTTVTFTFDHVLSPFTTDNYILQRAENYDTYWRTAVDTWRKGKIFLIE